ncbi:hypothetical protein OJAV_G00194820 [Oryzias javanicus]|uniref:Uncharacterized protein n=1 Tax=Oryzias javanicus TaxID=123683 RepID=A0A437CB91_ORYJA|nr:hypothetical protein OJAV_G00194820 [Oryzias javanicus]
MQVFLMSSSVYLDKGFFYELLRLILCSEVNMALKLALRVSLIVRLLGWCAAFPYHRYDPMIVATKNLHLKGLELQQHTYEPQGFVLTYDPDAHSIVPDVDFPWTWSYSHYVENENTSSAAQPELAPSSGSEEEGLSNVWPEPPAAVLYISSPELVTIPSFPEQPEPGLGSVGMVRSFGSPYKAFPDDVQSRAGSAFAAPSQSTGVAEELSLLGRNVMQARQMPLFQAWNDGEVPVDLTTPPVQPVSHLFQFDTSFQRAKDFHSDFKYSQDIFPEVLPVQGRFFGQFEQTPQ